MCLNIKKFPESEQLKQLNGLINKEENEIEDHELKIANQRQICREKQLKLASIKINMDMEQKI